MREWRDQCSLFSSRNSVVWHAVLAAAHCVFAAATFGQNADAPSAPLAHLKDGRERIWAYQGTCQLTHSFDASRGLPTKQVDFSFAGNYLADEFRFDFVRRSSVDGSVPFDSTRKGELREGDESLPGETKQIWNASGVTVWTSEGGANTLVRLVKEDQVSSLFKPFDVRAIGLIADGDMTNFTRFEKAWNTYIRGEIHNPQLDGKSSRDIVVETKVTHSRGTLPFTMWMTLDDSKDFVPEKVFVYIGRSFDAIISDDKIRAQPDVSIATEWISVQGHWLPQLCEILEGRNAVKQEKYVYRFSWEKINDELDTSLFEVAGLDIKNGASVIDSRGPQPVLVEIIDGVTGSAAGATKAANWRVWLMLATAIVVLTLAATWGIIAMRKSGPPRDSN